MARERKAFPKVARKRRAPAEARTELLDAAERVFRTASPEEAGLKVVAREAGVSHALITHYFGTYAGLVEATLERRVRKLREALLGRMQEVGALAQPSRLLGMLFESLTDPVHLRLMRWLFASEEPRATRALALDDQGLTIIAGAVGTALLGKDPPADKVRLIENALVTAVAAAYGYAMGKYALVKTVAHRPGLDLDTTVRDTLAAMLQAHLREVLGVELGANS